MSGQDAERYQQGDQRQDGSGGLDGVEALLFGDLASSAGVDRWVAQVVADHLGRRVERVLWRRGRVDAVHGLALAAPASGEGSGGRPVQRPGPATAPDRVVLKVHRPPADVAGLVATTAALHHLAARGHPCPTPLLGPLAVDGRTVSVQSLLDAGAEDGASPTARRAIASSLAEQVGLLAEVPGGPAALGARLPPRPAWSDYRAGPWPRPHDSVFNFTTTPTGWQWLDDVARRASDELLAARSADSAADPPVVGHADWYAGNLRFAGGRVVAAYDWDLVYDQEGVVAGLSAGAFRADGAPSPAEVAAFLADYSQRRPLSPGSWAQAAAAARWVLAYNARCDLATTGGAAQPGSALDRLRRDRVAYERLGHHRARSHDSQPLRHRG